MYTDPIFCEEPIETPSCEDVEVTEGTVLYGEPVDFHDVSEKDLAEMMSMFN